MSVGATTGEKQLKDEEAREIIADAEQKLSETDKDMQKLREQAQALYW